MLVPLRFG